MIPNNQQSTIFLPQYAPELLQDEDCLYPCLYGCCLCGRHDVRFLNTYIRFILVSRSQRNTPPGVEQRTIQYLSPIVDIQHPS